MANEINRAIEALADITSMQGRQISDLRESMQQSNQQLSDRIDQMGDRIEATVDRLGDKIDQLGTTLSGKIDDLAAQVSVLGDNITRLERTVDSLATDTREQHAIARSQSENVAQLVTLAQQQAQTVDRMLAVRG
ncbi:MAG: hypothetical protein DCF22_26065 [Leptolyngbya sp.]|nr:MAG: hypothetical protein DCF22_26065 [Leptolyngbya sp.]